MSQGTTSIDRAGSYTTGSRLDERGTARARLAGVLRLLQDQVRGSLIDDTRAASMAEVLSSVAAELAEIGTDDEVGELTLTPGPLGRSQSLSPLFEVTGRDGAGVRGTLTFTRFHLGRAGAVHGGSIALWGDDVLGRLALESADAPTRTAYLHVDYRALVPIEQPVQFAAWVDRVEGRKHYLEAVLTVEGTVAAEVHGLWVKAKKPGPST